MKLFSQVVLQLIAVSTFASNQVSCFVPSKTCSSVACSSTSSSSRSNIIELYMTAKKRIVVIGNGMVGQRFMENMIDLDKEGRCTLSTFCEEKRAAYNRVKLTSYFETRNPSDLSMTDEYDGDGKTAWYEDNNVEIFLNDKAVAIDTDAKTITGASGKTVDYDVAVLATGSFRKFTLSIRFASSFAYRFLTL